MPSKSQSSQVVTNSYPQALSMRHEIEALFLETQATQIVGDPEQNCNLIFVRLFRDTSPLRDTLFVFNVYAEHVLLRFALAETLGNPGDAKAKLVAQLSAFAHKIGLTFVFDEAIVYALSEEERALGKSLIPEAYRKKIEGLGIDRKEAQ
jgi:hypothetical protein